MKAKGNERPKKRRIAIISATVIVLAIAGISMLNCSAGSVSSDSMAPASESSASTRVSESAEASSEVPASPDGTETASAVDQERQAEQFSTSPGKTTSQDAISSTSGNDSQTDSPAGETPATTAPEASGGESKKQPIWVVDFEDIWVEDSPEWDESIPIYGHTEVSICNICGADITGNTATHGKQHMLAGEGSGHHSEVRETVTGYEMVHHGAQGHWERVESGGHWE